MTFSRFSRFYKRRRLRWVQTDDFHKTLILAEKGFLAFSNNQKRLERKTSFKNNTTVLPNLYNTKNLNPKFNVFFILKYRTVLWQSTV